MIEIRNLNVSFGGLPVLQNLQAQFDEQQVHGIIGLNGAGKTTFFNTLARQLQPGSGELLFRQRPLQRHHTGYLETNNFFYSHLTGHDYLNVFPKTNPGFHRETLQQLLQLPLHELTENYSTGMKKKLALLAILQQDKPIYLLDEPFNGLDLESNRIVELLVRNLQQKGKTVFVSSHVLEPLFHICDQIHLLRHGQFVQHFRKEAFGSIREQLFGSLETEVQQILDGAV